MSSTDRSVRRVERLVRALLRTGLALALGALYVLSWVPLVEPAGTSAERPFTVDSAPPSSTR